MESTITVAIATLTHGVALVIQVAEPPVRNSAAVYLASHASQRHWWACRGVLAHFADY